MDIIEDLKHDLLTRWKAQFDRMPLLAEAAGRGVRTVYATGSRFDVERYRPKKFPAGGRTSKEPIAAKDLFPGCETWAYLLDAEGRPVHGTRRIAASDDPGWEGMYSYSAEEAEYTEFYIPSRLPSEYTRLALRDGQPVSLQRLWVQAKGSFPILHGMPAARQAEKILAGPYFYAIRVDAYDLQNGRIESGWSWSEGFTVGLEPRLSRLEYSYSDEGKLLRIVAHAEDGNTWTALAARTKTSLTQLSATLSQRIAERVIDALQPASFGAPLMVAELTYASPGRYVPFIIAATQEDMVGLSNPGLVLAIDPKRWIELRGEDFAPEITEFMERMNSAQRWEAGGKMIRQAARMVTELGRGQPWAAKDFVAFASNSESDEEDLAKVLKDGGADPKTLKEWKKLGWL
jgi:hypothetical protein